jgi:hypothetical protein
MLDDLICQSASEQLSSGDESDLTDSQGFSETAFEYRGKRKRPPDMALQAANSVVAHDDGAMQRLEMPIRLGWATQIAFPMIFLTTLIFKRTASSHWMTGQISERYLDIVLIPAVQTDHEFPRCETKDLISC